jgi:hypothetical protein
MLVLAFLASAAPLTGWAAESDPIVGRSAVPMEEGAIRPEHEGFILAPEATFGAEGGADIPLFGENEPAIAVNPLDANNIAAAGLRSLRVSTDNGASFLAATTQVFPSGFVSCGDPSVAFDSQGRLFWTYLGCRLDNDEPDVFVVQVDPTTGVILGGYPVNVTAMAGFPASAGNGNDKQWIAADRFPGSPFQDRLYIVWTRFTATGTVVHATFSADEGLNWSPALTLSAAGEGFVWPSHNGVAANGDVYAAYHSQPRFVGGSPDGINGQIFVLRSTDGGVSYPQKNAAYTAGNGDITFNVQTATRVLDRSASWTQGSAQPWVLPDTGNPDNVYVIAADDPTNTNHGSGFDDMNIYLIRSTDRGLTWSVPNQIDAGPVGTTQFFPTAAMDDESSCLVVTWYDTRAGKTNAAGRFLLDLFLRSSQDGGLTFGPEVQLNDASFDPDLGAPARFVGPPPTLRIGEYNGVAVVNGTAHAVWTGNTATRQQILFDSAIACQPDPNLGPFEK